MPLSSVAALRVPVLLSLFAFLIFLQAIAGRFVRLPEDASYMFPSFSIFLSRLSLVGAC